MNVPVRDFKAKLSRYLREVHAGRNVLVMSRGRPVARLLAVPGHGTERPSREELLRRLKLLTGVRLGRGGKPLGSKTPIRIQPGQKGLAEIVLEDRD